MNGGLGILHPKEIELILLIRTQYRFGNIEIIIQDGLPQQVLKTIHRKALKGIDTIP